MASKNENTNTMRKTMEQEIRHMRSGNPDKGCTIGERFDNHVGHGHATKVLSIVEKTRRIDAGNGGWKDPKQFQYAFTQTGDKMSEPEAYIGTTIGKWRQGLTESCLKDGDHAQLFHNFDGTVKVTEMLYDKIIDKDQNGISPNERKATEYEIKIFVKIQQKLDPEYKLESGKGTVCIVTRLQAPSTEIDYLDQYKFVQGLYHKDTFPDLECDLYNHIVNPNKEANKVVSLDLSFGSNPLDPQTFGAFQHTTTKQMKYTTEENFTDSDYVKKYEGTLQKYVLEDIHLTTEAVTFRGKTSDRKAGYLIYRDDRLVSGSDPLFSHHIINTSSLRAKGIRLVIKVPNEYTDNFDEDFNIGCNKKITDDSFKSFNPDLREFLSRELQSADKEKTDKTKQDQKKEIQKYKTRGYNHLKTPDEVETEIETTNIEMEKLKSRGVWSRMNGKLPSYVYNTYIPSLKIWKNKLENDTEPDRVVPAVVEPAVVEPDVVEPAVVEPDVVEPAVVEPAVVEPDRVEPAVVEPDVVEPAVVEPDVVEPDVVEPDVVEPDVVEPDVVEPDVVEQKTTIPKKVEKMIKLVRELLLEDTDPDRLNAYKILLETIE